MKLVSLTFDDGPSEWTPAILDTLREHGARSTFFVIGAYVDERPELVRRMRADGHDVANHTYDHVNLQRASDDEIAEQVARCDEAIERATGMRPALFRSPFFRRDDRTAAAVARTGHVDVGADVYPLDWDPRVDADTIVARVLDGVGPRSIVCLHDGIAPRGVTDRVDCESTVEATRRLVRELLARDYALVGVTELLTWAPARTES